MGNIEHLTAKRNDEHLTYYNDCSYHAKATAIFQIESRSSTLKGTGIEHIPELQHNEDGEKEAQLITRKTIVGSQFHIAKVGKRSYISMLEHI